MNNILNQGTNRVLIAFGMYLVYELFSDIIKSEYSLKATYGDKSIILQKEPIKLSENESLNKCISENSNGS